MRNAIYTCQLFIQFHYKDIVPTEHTEIIKRLKKFAPTLQYLARCDKSTAKTLINKADPQLIDCVSDICYNILKRKVKLSSKEKARLARYKKQIRTVAKKSNSKKSKRTVIQKGGFLGAILAPLLGSLIGPLVNTLFSQKH